MKEKSTLKDVANNYLTHTKNEMGITLVALIVTIIILLILAGVGITALTQTDLFAKAREAKEIAENAQTTENVILGNYENKISEIAGSREEITVDKNEYNQLLKDVDNLKKQSTGFHGINTQNILQQIAINTEYTATEDCIVIGTVATYNTNSAYFLIFIDDTNIYRIGGSNTCWWDYSEIYFPLKKGQKFIIKGFNENYLSYDINAYGLL